MEKTVIRRARGDDVDAISQCAQAAYSIYVHAIGRQPAPMVADFASQVAAGSAHVLEAAKEVRGFIVFYPQQRHVHIENVAVDPQFQGKRYGRQLIQYAEQHARRSGYGQVKLYTNIKMSGNLRLYPVLGYVETARKTEHGFDRVYFEKNLTS